MARALITFREKSISEDSVGVQWPMYVSGNTYARKPGAADTFILVGNVLKELGMRRLMTDYCIR